MNGIERYDIINQDMKEIKRLLDKTIHLTKDEEFKSKLADAIEKVDYAYSYLRPAVEVFA